MKKFAAIVLSAGTGSRMKSDIPKQYMDLNGKPVIYYSLKAFQDSYVSSIILVTGKDDVEYCRKEIVEKYGFTKVTAIVPGGSERYESVYEGLKATTGADYVLVHDGARPMLESSILERVECAVQEHGACVVGMPVKDTIKIANPEGFANKTPERALVWSVQTPQAFSYSLLWDSYQKVYEEKEEGKNIPTITDDAMIVEYGTKMPVKLVEGSYENIKITTPEDLQIAALFLDKRSK